MVIICSNYLLFVFSLRDWKRLETAEKSSLQVAAGINISEWGIKRQKKENTKKTKRRKREEGKKKRKKHKVMEISGFKYAFQSTDETHAQCM